jgi:hypothetical protein
VGQFRVLSKILFKKRRGQVLEFGQNKTPLLKGRLLFLVRGAIYAELKVRFAPRSTERVPAGTADTQTEFFSPAIVTRLL